MAEEVYAVFGLREVSTKEEANRKAGKEVETMVGTEDSNGVPLGLHTAYVTLCKAENKADMKTGIQALYPGLQTSTIFYIKKANLEK